MKKFILFTILFFAAAASAVFGQTRRTPAKPTPKKQIAIAPKPAANEISEAEWSAVTNALDKENWTQAALLSSKALAKLKTDNDRKQLAQLRYFYLYALAGRAATGSMTYDELEKIASSFVGQEFLMPSRQFLADCTAKVNYICPVKNDANALRVTATDKSGTAIHSFEYVKLAEKPNVAANNGRAAFVGGVLQSAEVNLYKQNIRIMRLVFDKGFINIVASR